MASVSSRPSPKSSSSYDEIEEYAEEPWQYIDLSSGASAPGSIGFMHSPSSGSLEEYGVIGHLPASPHSGRSSLLLAEMDQQQQQQQQQREEAFFGSNTSWPVQSDNDASDVFATTADGGFNSQGEAAAFTGQDQLLFLQDLDGLSQQTMDMDALVNTFVPGDIFLGQSHDGQTQFNPDIPLLSQPNANAPPWNPNSLREADANTFVLEDFTSSPGSIYSQGSTSPAPRASSSNRSIPMRRVKTGKVEKKKPEQQGKFVIMTPSSMSASAGGSFDAMGECFKAMNGSQRGRKGPLADATKENALQVRRLGACFCCHSRKVKCDKERPCKNCKKLAMQVPQIVCWQFQDFVPVLFPDFIRSHLKKEEMNRFVMENVDGFTVGGREQPCSVELHSGFRFATKLTVQAKFFTPKTKDVTQHWHMNLGGDQMNLRSNLSAPICIEPENAAERDDLKKRTKAYIQEIIKEPLLVEQVTESFGESGHLSRECLRIVKRFADRTDSIMVKRALSIYSMHYIMTRHLILSDRCMDNLRPTGLVPQQDALVTPRVLNRQIKSIVDELMVREMQHLFELFSRTLKPKSRREWAPCLAAFIVLCLFMEEVETAADVFVMTQNEISIRQRCPPEYERGVALRTCKEVENLPFKQFAYQFHQIYQTHSKDSNAKSFNPIFDDSFAKQGELDEPALEMVGMLKELYFGRTWQDLLFLSEDPILPNNEDHPWPMSTLGLYMGRLVAKFLMSFLDEKAIFGHQS